MKKTKETVFCGRISNNAQSVLKRNRIVKGLQSETCRYKIAVTPYIYKTLIGLQHKVCVTLANSRKGEINANTELHVFLSKCLSAENRKYSPRNNNFYWSENNSQSRINKVQKNSAKT